MRTHRGTSRTHHCGRACSPLAVFSTLALVAGLFAAITVAGEAPASAARAPGEVVRYDFTEGSGTTIGDTGPGTPLDLTIDSPANVTWIPGGGLTVDANTVIASIGAATKVTSAVQASNEMTVEAWVTPAAGAQTGPARIVSSSANPSTRNFMLAQGAYASLPDDTFASRFRTASSITGTPTMFTPAGTAGSTLTHVVLTRTTSGIQTLYVNGVAEASSTIPGSTANWDDTYPLTLANIADGSRPWTGSLCLIAIYDSALSASEVGDNHEAGCAPTPNVDPVLGAVSNQTNDEGDAVLVDVDASDTDAGDVLAFSATNLPDGLDIDPATGEITGTITQTAETGSPYSVDITVDDQNGGADTTTIDWTVILVNVAPVLDPIGDQSSGQGQNVSLFVTATDEDDGTLAYTATGLPPSLAIDSATGEITGLADTAGSVSVTVTVDDQNDATDSESFDWEVVGNTAPTLDPVDDQTDDEGATVTLDIDATDDDNDTLAYTAVGLPDGLDINNATGEITGTITQTAASGSIYSVALTVDDAKGGTDTITIDWTVNPVNVAPVLDAVADQTNTEGATVALDIDATDDDNDTLAYTATGLPPSLAINIATGEITGTVDPGAAAGSIYSVELTADDTQGGTDTITIDWTIAAAPAGPTPVARYEFVDGAGSTVADSGSGPAMDLTISNPGNVDWVPGGGLTVNASTAIVSSGPATKVLDAVRASNEMSVEAWVTPTPGEQSGPARIVSNAPNPTVRNFMLGQGAWSSLPDDTFASRFRTTSAPSGTPTLFTPAGSATSALSHVVLTRTSAGQMTLYVNGVAQTSSTRTGTTANWNTAYPLVLANIADGSRPWLGTFCLVALYDTALAATDVADRHAAGCNQVPNTAPVLDPIGDQINDEGDSISVDVNATDPDGDPLVFSATGLPDGLDIDSATGLITGDLSQTAATGSPHTVGISVDDNRGGTDTRSFTWTVDDVPLPPLALDDAYGTPFDTPLAIGAGSGVLANDISEDPLTAELAQDAGSGTLVLASDGSFTYTPDPGFSGVDTFTYRAVNGSGPSDPATVRLTVAQGGTPGAPPRFVTGTVTFTRQVVATSVDQTHMAVGGDLDGDGDTDVAATDYVAGRVLWFENDGTGGFTQRIVDNNLDGAYPLHVDDLDADGDLDLLAAGYDANTFTWYENDGTASWTRKVIDGDAGGAHSLVTSDLDADGDLDLVASNQDANTITWYENDGAQGFTRFTVDSSAKGAKRAETADINGDGHTDIVATSNQDDTVAWYENDGNEGFVERTIDAEATGGYYVAPADLDGDGDIDVLAALQVADAVVWYENDGAGGFAKRVIDDTVLGARSVIASDVDGDGDMDAVSASPDDDTVSWYENDGTGGFSARLVDLAANGAYGISALDFDSDGDTDLISASRGDDTVRLHVSTRAHTAHILPGSTLTIDATELSIVDPDHGPAELAYTVEDPPASGALTLDGVSVPAGGVFTQADLNRGAVTFTHTLGSPPVTTFQFHVTDPEPGGQPISGGFTIIASDPADELAHLPLDEGGGSAAGDASGHGNNGTLIGGATFETDTPDGSTSAVRLDGASAAIHLPAIDMTGSGLTAALWFKADSFATSDARLVSKASGTGTRQHVFMISTIKVGNEMRLRARLRVDGDTTTIIAPAGTLTTDQWRHAALTHDADTARLYLDGIEVASTVLVGAIDTDPSLPVAIGAQPAGAGGRHFDGLVDDVHLLQRALTPGEVATLAGQGA